MSDNADLGRCLVQAVRDAGFSFVTGISDSEIRALCTELDREHHGELYLPGTREDNCVALAVGAYLAGETPLVFMKSAGVGTATDALTSLAKVYGIPLVLLVSWCGYRGVDVPHHNVIGEPLEPVLSALGIPYGCTLIDDVDTFRTALKEALETARSCRVPAAVLAIPRSLSDRADHEEDHASR